MPKKAISPQEMFAGLLTVQAFDPEMMGAAARYLRENPDLANQADGDDETPLMNACASGCLESIEVLLDRGVDVKHKNGDGLTALHMVAQYLPKSRLRIARMLINSGAEVDANNHVSCTPYVFSCLCGDKKLQKYLIEQGANRKLYDDFCEALEQIKALVSFTIPVVGNETRRRYGKNGRTPS